jgi:RNA polymerase sigma-70 factor (ECF subfamily)
MTHYFGTRPTLAKAPGLAVRGHCSAISLPDFGKYFARNRDLRRLGFRSTMMDANEREQYRAAIHGDRDAFEMIIRTHSRPLFAIAYGILQNREEAEDAVQDALVKAWKSRWRVRDPEKFPAWLAMIARHRARDVFRRRRPVSLSDEVAESFSTETNTSRDTITSADSLDRHIQSALAALPEVHRSALMLRYFEEMDYHTIEKTLGLTNGALRGILGRALAAMRKQLRPALAQLD